MNAISDSTTSPGDVRDVERRMAQLAGDANALSSRTALTAAFTALLGTPQETVASAASSERAHLPSARLERLIANASAASGNDPALVKAIVANESGFDPRATSSTGAAGLMQLMPATAVENGVRDVYDPAENVAGGTRYLARLLRRFDGDVPAALAAYNAGPETIAGGKLPAETQNYVRSVLTSYARYRGEAGSE